MPNVVSDIIVTPAVIYSAPVGTTLPADTLTAGTAWSSPWSNVGFTLEPFTLNYSFEVFEVRVQQTMAVVRRKRQTEELTFETVLAEHTAANLALALAGTSSVTAAGVGQPGKETFTVGGDPNLPERMWGVEGQYTDEDGDTFPVRIFIWKATAAEGGEITYDREGVAGIPLNISALADPGKPVGQQLMKIDRILEPATA